MSSATSDQDDIPMHVVNIAPSPFSSQASFTGLPSRPLSLPRSLSRGEDGTAVLHEHSPPAADQASETSAPTSALAPRSSTAQSSPYSSPATTLYFTVPVESIQGHLEELEVSLPQDGDHDVQGVEGTLPENDHTAHGSSVIVPGPSDMSSSSDSTLSVHGDPEESRNNVLRLENTLDRRPPLELDPCLFKSVQWDVEYCPSETQSRFEIVLGLSFKKLDLANAHQLLITVGSANPQAEVITNKTMRAMEADSGELIRLKVHTQVELGPQLIGISLVQMNMELIMLSPNEEADTRLVLHFLQLHEAGSVVWKKYRDVHIHTPHIWSIDVGHFGMIEKFAVSGDGLYIVVLIDGKRLSLYRISTIQDEQTVSPTEVILEVATVNLVLPPGCEKSQLQLSLSRDGSQISVSSSQAGFILSVYQYHRGRQRLELSKKHQKCLPNSQGLGEFGTSADIFLLMEKDCLKVCDTSKVFSWRKLRTIPHDGVRLDHCINGSCVGLLFASNQFQVWNLESATLISFGELKIGKADQIFFNDDSSLVFLRQSDIITSFLADTATLLSINNIQDSCSLDGLAAAQFEDKQVLIQRKVRDHDLYGVIWDMATLTEQSKFYTLPNLRIIPSSEGSLRCLSHSGASLGSFSIEDRLVHMAGSCDTSCITLLQKPVPSTRYGSLQIDVAINQDPHRMVLTVSDLTSRKSYLFRLPLEWSNLEVKAAILAARSKLVLTTNASVFAWSLPQTMDDLPALELIWSQDSPSAHAFVIKECKHGAPYLVFENDGIEAKKITKDSFTSEQTPKIISAIPYLIQLFNFADSFTQDDIIRFLGQYLSYLHSTNTWGSEVIASICRSWSDQYRREHEQLLKSLLNGPHLRWVPRRCTKEHNPGLIILERSRTEPTILGLFHILVDYCIARATVEQDTLFLWPITSCLRVLSDRSFPHRGLARRILHRLNFLPAPSKSFLVDHLAVAHPNDFIMKCVWNAIAIDFRVDNYKNNVLHLDRSAGRWGTPNPLKDKHSRELYVATFDMIWEENPVTTTTTATPASAWRYFIRFILGSTSIFPAKSKHLRLHDHTLDVMSNPALAALVEHKWNTLGFQFWVLRFCLRCGYYTVILVTVFIQIYSKSSLKDSQGITLNEKLTASVFALGYTVFIHESITLMAFHHSRHRDIGIASRHGTLNKSDIAAYIAYILVLLLSYLPLSFIVPLIGLQFLFELRVNKAMCRFVTIIVGIVSDIWIFFVIFFVSNVAFGTAILHLCKSIHNDSTSKFPANFYLAITSTFFFMAGRFDPISVEFDKGYWELHLMMVLYLFFNIIILVNVLIAIINVAFSSANTHWQLVWQKHRLGFAANAEELVKSVSFKAPKKHDWPQEIYYTVTPSQRRAYEKRWLEQEKQLEDFELYGQNSSGGNTLDQDPQPRAALSPGDEIEESETISIAAKCLAEMKEDFSKQKDKIEAMDAKIDHMSKLLERHMNNIAAV
ncbi:hypothetical protein BGZ72_005614 [Mortierella alpina]|nr:hypothetical protein BGZ72_005614 [Mortierella alpina]